MRAISRRQFAIQGAGFAVGAFAAGRTAIATAQNATPVAASPSPTAEVVPVGYVSLRIRALHNAALRPDIDKIVVSQFVPTVQALPGYAGYILGDVIEQAGQNLSVVVLQTEAEQAGFNTAAQKFIAGLPAQYAVTTPTSAGGDLYIAASASAGSGTPAAASPAATPVPAPLRTGYAAVRLYTAAPGKDPRETVPLNLSGLLPILRGIAGFEGYLWFYSSGTIGAISLFTSQASAAASTTAAETWAAAHVAAYFTGNPTVINANIIYSDLPVLTMRVS